jgi:hypothetical protein
MYPTTQTNRLILPSTGFRKEIQKGYLFNMGGPQSRARNEKIYSSVLGNSTSSVRCPLMIGLGLDFGNNNPIQWMEHILQEEKVNCPEELRSKYPPISTMCVCHISLHPAPLKVESAQNSQVLNQALLLGLCTASFYDPSRPVIWTNASLTRCLDLFNVMEFYR